MYIPAEDSYLLLDCAKNYRGGWALEIGVGSGLIADALCENFEFVAGSDIDYKSLAYCHVRNNRIMLVCCDAASAFGGRAKFDLVVSNPPYLPDDRQKDATVHGGPVGIETTVRFIMSALPLLKPEGKMLFVVSSLADSSALDWLAKNQKLMKRTVKEKDLFFERLAVVELSRTV